jgi:cytidylate kinase
MIVTIDGPAGAGKSTVARALARRLGFRYLDTGAMYRAVALAGMRSRVDWNRPEQLVQVSKRATIAMDGDSVFLDGEDVTEAVRSAQVTSVTRFSADNPEIRGHLVRLQRQAAGRDNVVTEGRDQGTVVFPQAECKIYLTASVEERARRRVKDFQDRGEPAPFEAVLSDMVRRDQQDTTRPVGPLAHAPDAVEVPTDDLTFEEVVARLEAIVRQRMQLSAGQSSDP